jgi:hypothetical protein
MTDRYDVLIAERHYRPVIDADIETNYAITCELGETWREAMQWCCDNVREDKWFWEHDWRDWMISDGLSEHIPYVVYFRNESDATLFALRWL